MSQAISLEQVAALGAESDFSRFRPMVPHRTTPAWVVRNPVAAMCQCTLRGVSEGVLPVALLPQGTIIKTEQDRQAILARLMQIEPTKYKSTSGDQSVRCWGRPFVDSATTMDYLLAPEQPEIEALAEPLVDNLRRYLMKRGFTVAALIDPETSLSYTAGVFRAINVVNEASVLHCDDFIRDGLKKPDFRLPEVLKNQVYYQLSFNVLLDDGGFEPDALFVHNRFYTLPDEITCLPNGWQFPLDLVARQPHCKFTPSVGSEYVFNTINYHDIKGGSQLANRVTFSVFAIYIPALSMMLLYN